MHDQPARGVAYLCLGVLVFSLQDAIVKQVSAGYALTQVLVMRAVVGAPLLLLLVHRESGWRSILSPDFWLLTARAALLLCSYFAYYMAFPALPLADAVALYFTVPLFVTALAGPFLGERSSGTVWLAIALGFMGVVVTLRPGSGLFEPAALLSLFSALMYAGSMLMARGLGSAQSASVMSFYQNAVFLVGASLLAIVFMVLDPQRPEHPSLAFMLRGWSLPTLRDGLLISSCGVIAAIGSVLLTAAYRVARASTVTPFEYSGVLWAPLWGFLFFAEVPRWTTVLGGGMIVVSGLLALRLARR